MSILVFLGLGSNLGDRAWQLAQARLALQSRCLCDLRASAVYETPPYQGLPQPPYYNQVVCGTTSLGVEALLNTCLHIEHELGRVRLQRWESRLIDIDILYYGQEIWQKPDLIVPHFDLINRGFVLAPLAELAPHWLDPLQQQTAQELYQRWLSQTQEALPVKINVQI